jgi:hypothetical protein
VKNIDLDALQAAAEAAHGWKWETAQGDQFGHLNEDGSFYDIGTVDADQYAVGEESHNEAVLNFIAAFNPQTCSALLDRLRKAEAALQKIARWHGEFPDTGRKWDDGTPMSYGACVGSNGERDYMRQIALDALVAAPDSTPTDSADKCIACGVVVGGYHTEECLHSGQVSADSEGAKG